MKSNMTAAIRVKFLSSSYVRSGCITLLLAASLFAGDAIAGLSKNVVSVDAGPSKVTGETFTYILSYSCSNTSGDCIDSRIVDVLPPEVVYVSHAATSDVATINTPSAGSNGTVEFILNTPLTAGNSGDVTINVRFPVGTTPDGAVASNTADGVNLETTPGTFPSNTVDVTAVANTDITLSKSLQSSVSYLDLETTYRLRVSNDGELNVANLDIIDTLPIGDVQANPPIFVDATPDADCEPGCLNTKVTTLQWSGLSVNAGQNRDITLTVQYDSADFSDGANVTNEFTAEGDPLGEAPDQDFGVGQESHTVGSFAPDPKMSVNKGRGGPNPATFNQEFYYHLQPSNTGNVNLENMILVDNLPIQFSLNSVNTGGYQNLSNLDDTPGAEVGVRVDYEASNDLNNWVTLGSSGDVADNDTSPRLPWLRVYM